MLYYTHVSPSVFDSIRNGVRTSIPVALNDVFLGDDVCFKEVNLNNGFTNCFVVVTVTGVQYGLDPEFPIEISWQCPKKGK